MRKGCAYNIKHVIDDNGEIHNSHCECPAGRGPTGTCKHIVAVLLALVKFANEGTLQVQLSCTEEIQTFKKPARSHTGSPVRAEKIGKGYDFDGHDPRPKKNRLTGEAYLYHLHNATTNFCAQSGLDITMRYSYPKADLTTADHDHDYLKEPMVVT